MQFTQLRPAHSYKRQPARLFNLHGSDALVAPLQHLMQQAQAECPAEGFTLLDHCYIYEACYVMTPDLEWLASSVIDYGIAEVIKPVIQDVIRGRHHAQLAPSPLKTVVMAKAGAANYGHVLTDMLPKLVNIGRSGLTAVRILLPEEMAGFGGLITAVLARLGVRSELEFLKLAVLQEAREVYVFSPVARHNTRKSTTFLELREVLASLYDVRFERRRRLFIQRSGRDQRKLLNADSVEAAFARCGYEMVHPRGLGLEQQLHLFASASHLAGPMGAGLANMAWAPPGCDVAMLDPGIGDTYFWDFACLLGQDFSWLFAGPLHGYTQALSADDFSIDEGVVHSYLGDEHTQGRCSPVEAMLSDAGQNPGTGMVGNYAILIKAHFWDAFLARRIAELQARAPSADCFLFLDETNGPIGPIPEALFPPERVLRRTVFDAERVGLPLLPRWRVFWYNTDYPLYLCAEALAPYDYVLMVEHDVVIRVDVDAMVAEARAEGIDFVCDPIEQAPEQWIFAPSLNGVYPDAVHRYCLTCTCLISRPAWRHLFAARLKHAVAYERGVYERTRTVLPEGKVAGGVIESWPFCEGVMATELGVAGFSVEALSRFGSVNNYDWYPPFLDSDVRESAVTGFIHPVLDERRYVESCFAGLGDAEQWFDPASKFRRFLNRCDPALVKARLERAFTETNRPELAERLHASA